MARILAVLRRAPVASYFALAFLFTWSLLPLAARSIAASLVALCGPAAAAFLVSAAAAPEERRAFRARLTAWRIPPGVFLVALLLPLPISALRSGLEWALGARGSIELLPVTPLALTVFVLVAGEEIGWRGFALPRLLPRFGPWGASAILGAVWALWHFPLFHLPGMPQFGAPFPPFVAYTVALSLLLTRLAETSRGSVPIATLFHGAVNTFGLVDTAAGSALRGWSNALAYGLVALSAGLAAWPRPGHRGRRRRG